MDSDTSYGSEYKQYNNTNQNNSGLLRFRSAPGAFLANFTDGTGKMGDEVSRVTPSGAYGNQFSHGGLQVFEDNKATANYASISRLPPQYPRPTATPQAQLGSVNGGYGVQNPGPVGINSQGMAKMGSSLMRQNSSPAGLFSHLQTAQNGYAKMRGIPSYAFSNGTSSSRDLGPSSNRLNSQMDFSSGIPSSLGMLSRISEVENETGGNNISNDEKIGIGEGQFYGSNFPLYGNSSSKYSGNFSGLKRELDTDQGLFSDNQGGEEPINQPPLLSRHLSLPKTSAEIAAMEKLMQFQDTIPCKIRAKRGCATHPRSIAERVRRTRISERMRKLQELVPNMDKQTNTADMLDLAVEYIKDLQKQYKTLTDIRANCKCSATQNSVSDQIF